MGLRKSDKYNTPYDRDMAYKEYNKYKRTHKTAKQRKDARKSRFRWFTAWFITMLLFA